MTKIYISPSMQKYNAYAAGNTTEAEQCHRIGEFAAAALKRCGFDVKLAPSSQTAEQNVAESNAWKPDYHLCIHTNAASGNARDVVVYTSEKNLSDACAKGVYAAVDALDSHVSVYGIRAANFYEIKSTSAKCIYVECEFHDNAVLAQWIIDHVEELGEAICKGFCTGAGVKYTTKESEKKKVEVETFTLEGAFDEGLVGLVRNGKPATNADFITALKSGNKVVVNAHDQSRNVVFDDEPPKYKIVDGGAIIAVKAEKGHYYPYSIFTYNALSGFVEEHDGRMNFDWTGFMQLPEATPKFFDIENSPYKADIEWGAKLGVAGGYSDGTFRPGEPCTRGMMMAFLHRLYNALKEGK